MTPAGPLWAPLLGFPLEWAAIALLTAGAIYWERAALSGIGIEGCVLSAMLGLCLGYEWSGSYLVAALAGVGASLAFALAASVLLLGFRSDPVVGSFCLSLIPAAGAAQSAPSKAPQRRVRTTCQGPCRASAGLSE